MSEVLRELWHAGRQAHPGALGADGLPLPHTLDQPDPPTEDPRAGVFSQGALGPCQTTEYPTLYLSGVRYRTRPNAVIGDALDARRYHWPPPMITVPIRRRYGGQGDHDEDPEATQDVLELFQSHSQTDDDDDAGDDQAQPSQEAWDDSRAPVPEGFLDHPNARAYHALDSTGFALLPPRLLDSPHPSREEGGQAASASRAVPPPPRDKCYYALPVRPWRIILYDEAAAPVITPIPTAEGGEPMPKHRKKRRRTLGGGGVGSGASEGPGGGIAQRRRELAAQLARLPPGQEPVKRLLNWQCGGGSLDDAELEVGGGRIQGAIGPQDVSDPEQLGTRRRVVFGVPVITLIELGLLPDQPAQVLDTLCEQLGLFRLGTRNSKRWHRKRGTPTSTVSSNGLQPPLDQAPMSKETLATILFPPLDPSALRTRVFAAASEAAASTPELPEERFGELLHQARLTLLGGVVQHSDPRQQKVVGALQSNRSRQETQEKLRAAAAAGPHYGPELASLLLTLDLQRTRRPARRGFHQRGWKHRVVPAWLLPFLLTQPATYRPYETNSDPWYACIHIGYGLRRLQNAKVMHELERASAWHDQRLMTLAISMAFKHGTLMGQMALGHIQRQLVTQRTMRRMQQRLERLEELVVEDPDDDDDDDDDDADDDGGSGDGRDETETETQDLEMSDGGVLE